MTRYGTSKHGHEWSMQNVQLEVTEEGAEGSVTIWLTAWDEELIETLNRIGINKRSRWNTTLTHETTSTAVGHRSYLTESAA